MYTGIDTDCTEVFDNGYQASAYNGAYDIQPITAPASFKVYCNFQYGYGITYALRRQTFAYDPSWEDAKLPAGEDLSVNPSSRNFFIGLENLRHLVTQADYTNLIFMGYPGGNRWGWTNYHNFSVGPSSTDYVITYDDFTFNPTYPADNGLSGWLAGCLARLFVSF
nr:hypothetical protein BaRGS_004322 [Batillaria attramentaria]